MTDFKAYGHYCEKCDRPLRKNECRRGLTRNNWGSKGYVNYCTLCDARTLDITNTLTYSCIGFVVFVCIVLFVVGIPQRAVEYAEVGLVVFLLPLLGLPILWWWNFKCKKIYNRWVHQHGTDPDKWPAPAKPE